jgi:hypothetical protein
MNKRVIYDNQSSRLIAETDGEIVQLTQELEGIVTGVISLYIDELEKTLEFAKEESHDDRY